MEGPTFDLEDAIEMRLERRPLAEIARVCGVSVSTLGYWFNKLQVPKPPAPARTKKKALAAYVESETYDEVHATAAEQGYESTADWMRDAVKEKLQRSAEE